MIHYVKFACKLCGKGMSIPLDDELPMFTEMQSWGVICAACTAAWEARQESGATLNRYEAFEASGAVRSGFAMYSTPPADIRAKNPANWEWVRTKWTPKMNIICTGAEGTGKSSLCRSLLCRYIETGDSAVDLPASTIERKLWMVQYDGELRRAQNCGALLIDDIDRADWTGRGLNALRDILDARHEMGRFTMITGNRNLDELKTYIEGLYNEKKEDNAGTMSLLRRMHPYEPLKFDGESARIEYRREMK